MLEIGQNLQFTDDQLKIDKLNAEFYGKIKYPWSPSAFEKVLKDDFWRKMIAQDLGYWQNEILAKNCKVWVAGCGTNQAVFSAMKFQDSRIIGSDLSKESLEITNKNAKMLHLNNLELLHESINDVCYFQEFDYITCTGVIHHNANPQISLQKLSDALKPSGIMELMVYNKFHRINTASFQLATRILAQCDDKPDLEKELFVAKMIVNGLKEKNEMAELLEMVKHEPEASFADSLLQPVEHSYTIESLRVMADKCGLELLHFCPNQFDANANNIDWNLQFKNKELQALYDNFSDIKRWYITNLLRQEKSPLLWFYLQKKDCPRLRKSEKQICDEFLNTKFKRIKSKKQIFILNEDNIYEEPISIDFPAKRFSSDKVKYIYNQLDENENIKKTFEKCGIEINYSNVNFFRLNLATSANPYIESKLL